jgi:transcriptional regulator with XRE-family HTH domain
MKALGLAIREVRKSKRQTLMDLHYDTRIGYQTLGEIEHGNGNPCMDTVIRIYQALEVTPSTLFSCSHWLTVGCKNGQFAALESAFKSCPK